MVFMGDFDEAFDHLGCFPEEKGIIGQFVSYENKKNRQVFSVLLQAQLQLIFLQAPGLAGQSLDAVAVDRFFKLFTAYGKPNL